MKRIKIGCQAVDAEADEDHSAELDGDDKIPLGYQGYSKCFL